MFQDLDEWIGWLGSFTVVGACFAALDFAAGWLANLGASIKLATGATSLSVFLATLPLTMTVALSAFAFFTAARFRRSFNDVVKTSAGLIVSVFLVWLAAMSVYQWLRPPVPVCNLSSDYRHVITQTCPPRSKTGAMIVCPSDVVAVPPANGLPKCDAERERTRNRYAETPFPTPPAATLIHPLGALVILESYWTKYGLILFLKALVLGFFWGRTAARIVSVAA